MFFGLLQWDFPSGLVCLTVSSCWQKHLQKFPFKSIPCCWCQQEVSVLNFPESSCKHCRDSLINIKLTLMQGVILPTRTRLRSFLKPWWSSKAVLGNGGIFIKHIWKSFLSLTRSSGGSQGQGSVPARLDEVTFKPSLLGEVNCGHSVPFRRVTRSGSATYLKVGQL